MNGTNGSLHTSHGGHLPFRPPSVDHALQYSPLSSIVPFSPSIIPFPSAGPPGSSTIFNSPDERRSARRGLDSLNSEAGGTTSAKLQKTLQDLQKLLNGKELTQFNFKTPAYVATTPVNDIKANGTAKPAKQPPLSQFATMVLNNTEVSYRYPTPDSPQNSGRKHDSVNKNQQAPKPQPQKLQHQAVKRKEAEVAPNARIQISPNAAKPPKRVPIGPVVVIPGSSIQRDEYLSFPHINVDDTPSKNRKREDAKADNEALSIKLDQKQKADDAVEALEDLLQDIFEAEDHCQPDTSGVVSQNAAKFFTPSSLVDSDLPVLVSSRHHALDLAIRRVVSAGRFPMLPVDDIKRIQTLCENAVTVVDGSSLTIGLDWSEGDVDEWVYRIAAAENGLQAGRIILRTMTAGREEKQIYSEDVVQAVIGALKYVFDMCLVPIVESRKTESGSDIFNISSAQKQPLFNLLEACRRLLRLLGDLIVKVDVAERAITSVEYLCTTLIFVENAHSEKDSALGIQKFELLRRHAMDVLAKIFARYEDQREFIFKEIIGSLQKLPVNRQSARQYKIVDGKPIQLVSALLMQLVQTCATRSVMHKTKSSQDLDDEDEDEESDSQSPLKNLHSYTSNHDQSLVEMAKSLHDAAQMNARLLVYRMVQPALTSTKSGEQPHRNLLDNFTQDFVNVLGFPDWPAAQLLLWELAGSMVNIVEEKKNEYTVPAKNMALDLLGVMASGISDLKLQVRQASQSLNRAESELSARLVHLSEDVLRNDVSSKDLLAFDGPYRVVLEDLQNRAQDDNARLQSAQGCQLTFWAKSVCDIDRGEDGLKSLKKKLKSMVLDPKWLTAEYEFHAVNAAQGRLAAGLTTLQMPFCRSSLTFLNILLISTGSTHATIRSRSLKSVEQLLDKDTDLLNDTVVGRIVNLTMDSSPLVRDSALGFLGKCLSKMPSLERDHLKEIISRANDAAIGVRKKAIKILKEIYLRNEGKDVKSAIAGALLHRIKDLDESVADLARQTFEDIWILPFHEDTKTEPIKLKLALRNHVSLMVRTVQRGEGTLIMLEALLQSILSNTSKHVSANYKVCRQLVAEMFEAVIDNDILPDKPSQPHILQTLTIFAKANPMLFSGEQLERLQPYTQNIEQSDNLQAYRSVLVVFRHVFPTLATYQTDFLRTVNDALMRSVSKMPKAELNEIAQCLWILHGILKDTTEKITRMLFSCVKGLQKDDSADQAAAKRIVRYLMIVGSFGRYCDIESLVDHWKAKMPSFKGSSVAGLFVDIISPFTRQKHPRTVREQAFESLGMICQAWPKQFMRADVSTSFDLVFVNNDARLEEIVLNQFTEFFASEEKRSETGAEIAVGEGAVHGSERLGISLVANDIDGVSIYIAQRFLSHIVRIALGRTDDLALAATRIIVSINRQGLVHPKECGPALVALETSANATISNIAFVEHRSLHHKHETMFEKEYMKAVSQAFDYQRDVMQDTHGATTRPFSPKLRLLFEVLKTGNSRVRKKFLSNLCEQVNFELPKLNSSGDPPSALLYARFCLENLAFFDFARVDEILNLISCMEKAVTVTGAVVAHAIETDILGIRLDSQTTSSQQQWPASVPDDQTAIVPTADTALPNGQPTSSAPIKPASDAIDEKHLRHLTVASMILTMLWEVRTFLRRQWGLQKQSEGKTSTKIRIKDLNKAPIKVAGVTGDKCWERISEIMTALDNTDVMTEQCKAFAELLAVDNELKNNDSEDEDAELARAAAGYETPSDDDDDAMGGAPLSGGGRGRKRKASAGATSGTPKKQKKAGSGKPRGRPKKNPSRASGSPRDGDGGWD
ncbi:hypothetical protein K432DRAFT_427029 [Lepidopterella palustris CBS 459.81]|uniref:Sister chromatid cohesion protein n=1 Tax=Lepidopterella palustris CBS 459.81 TaxID=1314670 RepID=A0A8E2JDQ4_9PEZI|nr:hypothetical protein K432DRAFT_427029 [Lepidopterella palustris CBS 459.81]